MKAILSCLLALLSFNANASSSSFAVAPEDGVETRSELRKTISAGLKTYYFQFEQLSGNQSAKESGFVPGGQFQASIGPATEGAWNLMAGIEFASPSLAYTASSGGKSSAPEEDSHSFTSYSLIAGKQDASGLEYYGGVTYSRWGRGGERWLRYTYSTVHLPLGLKKSFRSGDWKFGASGGVLVMVSGNLQADSAKAPSYSLGNRLGLQSSLPVSFDLDSSLALTFTPWYQYSAFGQSDIVTVSGKDTAEPDSSTHQFGTTLGVAASF